MVTAAGTTRVLIVDDDVKLCRLLKDYLDPFGFDLTFAHAGPEGLTRALEPGCEAVILDVMLPGLDGFEVLRRLRASSAIPVLMLTARGEEIDRIAGLEVGADDYLPKTFSPRELLASVLCQKFANMPWHVGQTIAFCGLSCLGLGDRRRKPIVCPTRTF
jgi:two-component system response regulator CpxR